MRNEGEILDILEWLWDVLSESILLRLGYDKPPGEGCKWPHIWWCPTGMLSLLPIHAAGYHRDDHHQSGHSVLDRVTSAYTPTVRALKFSRESLNENEIGKVFIAAMPSTPNMARLKLATREAFGVVENLRYSGSGKKLAIEVQRKDVSVEKVYEQLPNVSVAHFICHAVLDEQNPSASGLVLENGAITVAQISQARLHNGSLAYLSACSTANTGITILEDEAITLSSAFQLAGFSRIIGTSWNAVDRVAYNVAMSFYQNLENDVSNS